MKDLEREDERLARLLAAVGADADPALWTRVRAHIEAGEARRAPRLVGWMLRPAALGASFAMLGVALVAAAALVATAPRVATVTGADNLADALVAELETQPGTGGPASDGGARTDTGVVR
jgi:hypothetical protein